MQPDYAPTTPNEEDQALGEHLGFAGATGALLAGGVQAMLKKHAAAIADSIIKAAGLGDTFDVTNRQHVTHVQAFVKRAKASCETCWHDLDHVRKVASHGAMRETYTGLLMLEKWVDVMDKTANATLAQLADDPQTFQELAQLRDDLRTATVRGAALGGGAGAAIGWHHGSNPLVGAALGAAGGGILGRLTVPVDLRTAGILNAARHRQQPRLNG